MLKDKIMYKHRVTLLAVLVTLSVAGVAQDDVKTIKDFVNESDEVFFGQVAVFTNLSRSLKKEIKDGLVTAENIKPKKIGLVTTYLFEEKFASRKAHFLYVHSDEGIKNYFFHKMAEPLVAGVKAAFEGSEMELLSPSDFLKVPSDQDKYEKLAKKLRTSDPFSQIIRDFQMDPSGGEFEFIYTLNKEGESGKIMDGLAEYAREQGLDAILGIEINTKYMTKAITFNGINFTLHGINPDSKKGFLFHRYSLYADMYYPVAFIKSGKLDWQDFAGFKDLGERVGKDYINYIDESIRESL